MKPFVRPGGDCHRFQTEVLQYGATPRTLPCPNRTHLNDPSPAVRNRRCEGRGLLVARQAVRVGAGTEPVRDALAARRRKIGGAKGRKRRPRKCRKLRGATWL